MDWRQVPEAQDVIDLDKHGVGLVTKARHDGEAERV